MKESLYSCRLIVAELNEKSQLQTTKFPAKNLYLPIDLSFRVGHEEEAIGGPQCSAPLEVFESKHVSSFGRQAQAVYMLDQSLHIFASSETCLVKLRAAKMLDEKLQEFLALIMRDYTVPGRQCGANAIVIRYAQILRKSTLQGADLSHFYVI